MPAKMINCNIGCKQHLQTLHW